MSLLISAWGAIRRSYLVGLLNTKDLVEQDAICNELVLNLRVGNDSVSVITLNTPYDLMVDLAKISAGRDLHMLLELFKYIIEQPEPSQALLTRLKAPVHLQPKVMSGLVF